MWGALSDVRTGMSFIIVVGPRQRNHSRGRVPLDSRPYFTVSDSRLPSSSPPTTRRATVEVFDPVSTRDHTSNTQAWFPRYTTSEGTQQKHCFQQFLYCVLRIRCRVILFTEPLPSNGRLLWLHYSCLQASCHNTHGS
jgi:hypothetical protein